MVDRFFLSECWMYHPTLSWPAVSARKTTGNLMGGFLVCDKSLLLLFSKFSLALNFDNLIVMYLCVGFYLCVGSTSLGSFEPHECGCSFNSQSLGSFQPLLLKYTLWSFLFLFSFGFPKCVYCFLWWCSISPVGFFHSFFFWSSN